MRLLITGASEIVRISCSRQLVKLKEDMKDVAILRASQDQGLSIAVDQDGKISAIGTDAEVSSKYPDKSVFTRVIDAPGQSIVPGLVDAHTHPVWAGDRVHEFSMKLSGASYMDIHKAGGGIHYTVDHTRRASPEVLLQLLTKRLQRMSRTGTTLVECKSGYGLDTRNELKMLKVIEAAKQSAPLLVSTTYCGAHAVPRGMTAESATQDVLQNQLPAVIQAMKTNEIQVDNIDVFCEKGVFDVSQSEAILKAGKEAGLAINFHAEELNYLASAQMGASMSATAMSHLEEISEEGIMAMASSGSVAVLLPTTAHLLRLTPPPARRMISAGVPVALGSDFNPNAYCSSMPFVMSLACVQLHLSPEEALVAATLNAAHSLRLSRETGSLELGKRADLLILASSRWEHLIYQLGDSSEVIQHVVANGAVVHSNPVDRLQL